MEQATDEILVQKKKKKPQKTPHPSRVKNLVSNKDNKQESKKTEKCK